MTTKCVKTLAGLTVLLLSGVASVAAKAPREADTIPTWEQVEIRTTPEFINSGWMGRIGASVIDRRSNKLLDREAHIGPILTRRKVEYVQLANHGIILETRILGTDGQTIYAVVISPRVRVIHATVPDTRRELLNTENRLSTRNVTIDGERFDVAVLRTSSYTAVSILGPLGTAIPASDLVAAMELDQYIKVKGF